MGLPGLTRGQADRRYDRLRTFNVKAYGAVGDVRPLYDGAITSGSATLTNASGGYVNADAGKAIRVVGAGAAGADLCTTILSRQSSTAVTLAANAGTTVSAARTYYGTDDSTAVLAACAARDAAGKGVVYFPAGGNFTDQFIFKNLQRVIGEGPGITTLYARPGSTLTSVVESYQFATLAGTNHGGGVQQARLEGFSVDASGATYGIRIYGPEYRMDDVNVFSAASDGITVDYSDGGGGPTYPDSSMESYLNRVKSLRNGGWGFKVNGGHDSNSTGCIGHNNASGQLFAGGSGWKYDRFHAWGQGPYGALVGGDCNMVNCDFEGGTTAQLYIQFGGCRVHGTRLFFPGSSTAAGLLVGDSGHANIVDVIATDISLGGNGTGFSAASGPAVDLSYAAGRVKVAGTTDQTAGIDYQGPLTPVADLHVDLDSPLGRVLIEPTRPGTVAERFNLADNATPNTSNITLSKGTAATTTVVKSKAMYLVGGATGGYSGTDRTNAEILTVPGLLEFNARFLWTPDTINVEDYLNFLFCFNAVDLTSTPNGYGLTIATNTSAGASMAVDKYTTGTKTNIIGNVGFGTLSAGDAYWFRVRRKQNLISVKRWLAGTTEPVAWTFPGTLDSLALTGARMAFNLTGGSAAAAGKAYIDNLTVTPI